MWMMIDIAVKYAPLRIDLNGLICAYFLERYFDLTDPPSAPPRVIIGKYIAIEIHYI